MYNKYYFSRIKLVNKENEAKKGTRIEKLIEIIHATKKIMIILRQKKESSFRRKQCKTLTKQCHCRRRRINVFNDIMWNSIV